jgi:hypothetical protein
MEPKARTILADTSRIPGWGVDAEAKNDPTWPMRDRSQDDSPGRNWISPVAQPQDIEVLMSIEHNQRPAVFGTSAPPSGVSGQIRRLAFKASESRWTHWLLLMFADRINVVEGVLEDIGHGRLPNLVDELGVKAAWKYDRSAFLRRAGGAALAAALIAGAGYAVLQSRSRRR